MNARPILGVLLALTCLAWPAAAHEIHDAARAGDLDRVRSLLEGAPELLELKDENEKTPLHFAAEGGNTEVIRFLLDRKAAVNAPNVAGETPLHYAAGWCHLEAVKLLLERGADVTRATREGDTPLHYMRFVGRRDVAELLLDKGADLEARNNAGVTFLGMAVTIGRPRLVDLAFSRGAKVNPEEGMGMLVAAAEAGDLALLDQLREKGVNAEAGGEEGIRLLHAAAEGGHGILVNELLSKGADLKSRSPKGGTLLHGAARGNLLEVGRKLISAEIDLDARDRLGRTARHISEDWGNTAFNSLLEQSGAQDLPRDAVWLTEKPTEPSDYESLEISYIANDGFMINASTGAIIMVDSLIRNPWGYLNTPGPVFERMKASAPPFTRLDLMLFSHAHRDHFEPEMAFEVLRNRKETILVGNSMTVGELREAAGSGYSGVRSRISELNPDWGTTLDTSPAGIQMKVFPVNHGAPEQPYMTLGYLLYLGGLTVLHLGDMNPPSNVDLIPRYGLENEAIDIAFLDPFFIQSEAGARLLKDHIRPNKIILMHMRPNETDRYAGELGKTHDNILVFHEPLERKVFHKAKKRPAR